MRFLEPFCLLLTQWRSCCRRPPFLGEGVHRGFAPYSNGAAHATIF